MTDPSMNLARRDYKPFLRGLQLALRASAAAGVAIALAQLLGLPHPVYAFLAAVIVTDLAPSECRKLALHRLVATVVGAVCGALLTQLLPAGPLAIGFSILVAMLACQLVQVPDAAKVAGFICGIIVLEDSAEPWLNAFFRFVETTLGVVVALLVSYVPKLLKLDEPDEESVRQPAK
jgi:uncharacterized membrane protein YgaE (UPF0421/DUF939 family)